jgi:hypothetical protein
LSNSSSIFRCSCGWGRLGLIIFLFSHRNAAKKGPRLSPARTSSNESRAAFYPEGGEKTR